MSLYVKFIWFTFMTMLVSSLIGFFAMNIYYDLNLKQDNNDKNLAIAQSFASFVEEGPAERADASLELLGESGYQLYVTSGTEVLRYGGSYRNESLDEEVISQVLSGEEYNGIRDFPREAFVTGFFANELRNTVGVPVEIDGETYALFLRPNIGLLFQELHWLFGGLAAGIVILSFIGMTIVARFLITPISTLTVAAEEMTGESFDRPVLIRRKDEIGRLADRFVAMRAQMERSISKRKEFVHHVSHDIQSPLHTIQSSLALLEKSPIHKQKEIQEVIGEEVNRISLLTNQLLTLASFDQEELETFERVTVGKQVQESVERLRYVFEEKEHAVTIKAEDAVVKGNAILLQTVWENLLTNAAKYSDPGGMISVKVWVEGADVAVRVKDNGVGMSETEIERAFDRFYRADEARAQKGSGLGLSIVKEIIDLHQGEIRIESTPNEGTLVEVRLQSID
ncbi:HAMP domain-containing histidine kinase [Jeotgalibacillus sp. S-D1]|uniref:sensor histidine kinase n=1 Tax=Jeotgalibacillus sp. S-D1 TaxID=2552189 RepID=UPI00105A0F5E|nr:HAMP domain-containing sensor histidine kinase [Jeotgalibacillus sp. S-D1]TDL32825.1 HAMP domain-containing histidine kinase [Jeotgalibacillus sp. S-D1]